MRRRGPARVLAAVLGALGLAALVVGSVVPWYAGSSGFGDPAGAPLPGAVATIAAGAATLALQVRPRWVWLPTAVLLLAVATTALSVEPGWMCWDGVDEDGNWVGGCEDDEATGGLGVFGGGAALMLMGSLVALVAAPGRGAASGPQPPRSDWTGSPPRGDAVSTVRPGWSPGSPR